MAKKLRMKIIEAKAKKLALTIKKNLLIFKLKKSNKNTL